MKSHYVRDLNKLAWPNILESTLQIGMVFVDAIFVARLGLDAVSAVGLASTILIVVNVIPSALGSMTNAMVAQTLGEKKRDSLTYRKRKLPDTKRYPHWRMRHLRSLGVRERPGELRQMMIIQATYLSAGLGLLLGLLSIVFAPEMFRLYGADEQIVEIGASYLRIVGGASIFSFLMIIFGSALRGIKDSKSALKAGFWMNAFHLVIDAVFIFWFHFGVVGVACATVLARIVGMSYLILQLRRKIFLGRKVSWKLNWKILRKLVTESLPLMGSSLSNEVTMFYYFRILIPFGPDIYAASRITSQIKKVLMPPMVSGYTNATITLVGEQYGKRNYREVMRYCSWGIGLVSCFSVMVWLIQFLIGDWIVRLFTNDPQVLQHAGFMLSTFVIMDSFWAIGSIVNAAFRGISNTKPILFGWMAGSALLVGGVWLVSHNNWGWQQLFIAQTAQYVCIALLASVWFYSRRWITRLDKKKKMN